MKEMIIESKRLNAFGASFARLRRDFRKILSVITTLLAASEACVVGPKYQRPNVPAPPAFKESLPEGFKEMKGWKVAEPNDGVNRGKWWEIFRNQELNALEEQVDVSNQNLLAAEAQYRAARDAIRIERANLYPFVTSGISIADSRSAQITSPSGNTVSGSHTLEDLSASLSYLADTWGSVRRSIRGSAESAQASAAQLENARLAIHSVLAQLYFQLRGIDGEEELFERTVKSYEEYLDLTKIRFDAGVASGADVAQAQTQLSEARAQRVDLGEARAQYEHAIAVLVGKAPAELSIAGAKIDMAPPPIPVGVPSDLLERRPDIAAAERQMAVANEQIGIAKAAFYPSISLSASVGLQSSRFADWFLSPSGLWTVGGQLAQTLFDAGKRRAQKDFAQASYDAVVANYRQTVLTSFQQVEDSLSALRVLADETLATDETVRAASESLEISTYQYKAGTASYLQVITAQTSVLQNQILALNILTRRMLASVLLIEALGGGWDSSSLPTEKLLISGKQH